jgi:hypothetical protein
MEETTAFVVVPLHDTYVIELVEKPKPNCKRAYRVHGTRLAISVLFCCCLFWFIRPMFVAT